MKDICSPSGISADNTWRLKRLNHVEAIAAHSIEISALSLNNRKVYCVAEVVDTVSACRAAFRALRLLNAAL